MNTPQPEGYSLDGSDVLAAVYAYDSQGNVIPWPEEYASPVTM